MYYFASLSMDNPALAVGELELLLPEVTIVRHLGRYVVFTSTAGSAEVFALARRLAYTQSFGIVVMQEKAYNFVRLLQDFDWQSCVADVGRHKKGGVASYWVVLDKVKDGVSITTPQFARIIGAGLPSLSAVSEQSDVVFLGVCDVRDCFVGVIMHSNDKSFLQRAVSLRPAHHPSSTQSKLAKALVNLSGIHKGVVLDPFCGVGGILIESALMGLYPVGCDIDQQMLTKAHKNLEHYGITSYQLFEGDACTVVHKADVIITDLPFGRATKDIDAQLYERFLRHALSVVRRAVVVFPSTVDALALVRRCGWHVDAHFSYYLHKTLSKTIVVMRHK